MANQSGIYVVFVAKRHNRAVVVTIDGWLPHTGWIDNPRPSDYLIA
jgi:hypothetical protein